jgi:hypothetical protein
LAVTVQGERETGSADSNRPEPKFHWIHRDSARFVLRRSLRRLFCDESVQDLIQDATILDRTPTHHSFPHEASLFKDAYGCCVLTEWNRKDSPEVIRPDGIASAAFQSSGSYPRPQTLSPSQ